MTFTRSAPRPSCPSDEQLRRLAFGQASEKSIAAFEAHISQCKTCEAAFDALGEQSDTCVRGLSRLPCVDEDEPDFQRLVGNMLSRPEPFGSESGIGLTGDELAPSFELPFQLGEYELVSLLGQGAFGSVYKARHCKLDRWAAVKILLHGSDISQQRVQRFLQEMRAIGRLDHPHIIRATDAGESDGWYFLVMEYEPGIDVSTLLRQGGPLSVANACEIARQAATALCCVHEHHIVHRDIKPSNLLLTETGQIKLLDLGLVSIRDVDDDLAEERRQTPRGTADYMSPEQWTNFEQVDIRGDLYSLGCTLYKLLTGQAPFQSCTTTARKMAAHHRTVAQPLRAHRNDISDGLQRIVARLLEKEPESRIQTPDELVSRLAPFCRNANLGHIVQPDSCDALPPTVNRQRPSRRQLLAIPALALAVWGLREIWPERAPLVDRQKWRRLVPAHPHRLLTEGPPIQWSEATATTTVTTKPKQLALVNLGQPVVGRFSLAVMLSQRNDQGSAGLFFRFRSRRTDDEQNQHTLQSIELVRDEQKVKTHRLVWCRYDVRQTTPHMTELDEAVPNNLTLKRLPLADIPLDGSQAATIHRLEVTLGYDGFPLVSWDDEVLQQSKWMLSFPARQQASIANRELESEFLGRLGLIVHNGAATFRQPELRYSV